MKAVSPYTRMDKEHLLHQEEAYRRKLQKTLQEYGRQLAGVHDWAQRNTSLEQALEKQSKRRAELIQELQEVEQLLQHRAAKPTFSKEYEARQRYYENASATYERYSSEDWTSLAPPHSAGQPVVVMPDALPHDPTGIDRMFRELAERGALVFRFHASSTSDDSQPFTRRAPGYYEFSNESLMLAWIKRHSELVPIVLCNWVLQSAWYDLIAAARIWYHLGDTAQTLFGGDPESRLKHWELLQFASAVTYSGESNRYLTYHRKDAIELPGENREKESAFISLLMEVGDLERLAKGANARSPFGGAAAESGPSSGRGHPIPGSVDGKEGRGPFVGGGAYAASGGASRAGESHAAAGAGAPSQTERE